MGPREPRAFKKSSDEALAARHGWNGFWRTVHSRRLHTVPVSNHIYIAYSYARVLIVTHEYTHGQSDNRHLPANCHWKRNRRHTCLQFAMPLSLPLRCPH